MKITSIAQQIQSFIRFHSLHCNNDDDDDDVNEEGQRLSTLIPTLRSLIQTLDHHHRTAKDSSSSSRNNNKEEEEEVSCRQLLHGIHGNEALEALEYYMTCYARSSEEDVHVSQNITTFTQLERHDNDNDRRKEANAMRLEVSVASALVYVELLRRRGAIGVGLVDVATLARLCSVLNKYVEWISHEKECEEGMAACSSKKRCTKNHRGGNKRSRRNDSEEEEEEEEDAVGVSFVVEEGDNDGDEEDDLIYIHKIRYMGNKLCLALAHLPLLHYKQEAREMVIDALLKSVAIVSAEQRQTKLPSNHVLHVQRSLLELCKSTNATSTSVRDGDVKNDEVEVQNSRDRGQEQNVVYILRGLMRILLLEVDPLPGGQKGKIAAHEAAITIVASIAACLTDDANASVHVSAANIATPNRSLTNHINPNKTVQFSVNSKSRRRSISKKTPPRRRSTGEDLTPSRKSAWSFKKGTPDTVLKAPSTYFKVQNQPEKIRSKPLATLIGLMQKLLTHSSTLKHSNSRARVANIIRRISLELHECERSYLQDFISNKLCRGAKGSWRLMGLELIGEGDISSSEESCYSTNEVEVLRAIILRLSDKIPAVRAKCAMNIHQFYSKHPDSKNSCNFMRLQVIEALSRRLEDERATVRRAAVLAMGAVLMQQCQERELNDNNVNTSMLCIDRIGELCSDHSVQVRRASAETLSKMLQVESNSNYFTSSIVSCWVHSVLPLVCDEEASCASKAIDILHEHILQPIINLDEHSISWSLLNCIFSKRGSKSTFHLALEKLSSCGRIAKKEIKQCWRFCHEVISSSVNKNESDHCGGAWCLVLGLVCSQKDRSFMFKALNDTGITCQFLIDCLNNTSISAPTHNTIAISRAILQLVPLTSHEVPNELRSKLEQSLMNMEYTSDTLELVAPALNIVGNKDFVITLYQVCASVLEKYIQGADPDRGEEDVVGRALYTLGEATLLNFNPNVDDYPEKGENVIPFPDDSLLQMCQILLAPTLPLLASDSLERPNPHRAHAVTALGKLCLRNVALAKNCINMLARELVFDKNVRDNAGVVSNVLVVLGDLCVRYTSLVDRHLHAMSACLQFGIESSAQNTGSVLNLSGDADDKTKKLSNVNSTDLALVRKHAVILLSSLMLQDYIKFRHGMFFRFLAATVDEDEGVASLAEMTLCGPLLSKTPLLFVNNFVEAMFVLNHYVAHPMYAASNEGSSNSHHHELPHFCGPSLQFKRMATYRLMISYLNDEQKIMLSARLAKEVLLAALETQADEGLNIACWPWKGGDSKSDAFEIHQSAVGVLSDTFAILLEPMLRVGRSQVDNIDEDTVNASVVSSTATGSVTVEAVKNKLLSKISKKHLIETVIPILCSLKKELEANRSPLIKDLMRYMYDIFCRNKADCKEALATDPNLLKEIMYDLKQLKKRQSARKTPNVGAITSFASDEKSIKPVIRDNVVSSVQQSMRQPNFGDVDVGQSLSPAQ